MIYVIYCIIFILIYNGIIVKIRYKFIFNNNKEYIYNMFRKRLMLKFALRLIF